MIELKLYCPPVKGLSITLPETGFVTFSSSTVLFLNTVCNVALGLDFPYNSTALYNGEDLVMMTDLERSSYRSDVVASGIPDDTQLLSRKVREFFNECFIEKYSDSKIEEALKRFGLDDISLDQECLSIPIDKREFLFLARAMIKNPKILVVNRANIDNDEFTINAYEFYQELAKECLVILTTTDDVIVKDYCDRLIFVNQEGKVGDTVYHEIPLEHKVGLEINPKRISFSKSIKYAVKFIRKYWVNAFLIVLTFALGMSLIGLTASYFFYDETYALTQRQEPNSRITLYKKFKATCLEYDVSADGVVYGHGWKDYELEYKSLITPEEIEELNNNSFNMTFCGYTNRNVLAKFPHNQQNFKGFAEADEEFMKKYNYELLCGHYPTTYNEVALTAKMADEYMLIIGEEYSTIIGKTFKITTNGGEIELTISGIYSPIAKYPNRTDDDFVLFVNKGFSLKYKLYNYDNTTYGTLKSNGYLQGTSIDVGKEYFRAFSQSYISYNAIDFDKQDYLFFDLDGNPIEGHELSNNECYIPYCCRNYEGGVSGYLNRLGFIVDLEPLPINLKGYYISPVMTYANPIITDETLAFYGFQVTKGCFYELKTDYKINKDAIYSGMLSVSDFSYEQIQFLEQQKDTYRYTLDYSKNTGDLERTSPKMEFMIWGIAILLVSLGLFYIFMLAIAESKEVVLLRRNGFSNRNLRKIFFVQFLLFIPVAIGVSVPFIILQCLMLNVASNMGNNPLRNNPLILHINGQCYLFCLIFALVYFGISALMLIQMAKHKKYLSISLPGVGKRG